MTEQEKINGWTFEETVKNTEAIMDIEENILKWDTLRHLRDFTETYKEELEQYRALGTIEQLETLQDDYWKLNEMCKDYSALGTVEELKVARDKQVAMKICEHNFYDEPHYYQCPNCKNMVIGNEQEYCEECGQKLNWEEV